MISLPPQEDQAMNLPGSQIASELVADVVFQINERIGEGGMAIAYAAMRFSPQGQCPVVVKVMRPWAVRQYGDEAALTVKKEAVALGRLNERVPPTPFVVRLLDVGSVRVSIDGHPMDLPWIALEYVYGGPQGTTLTERVATSIAGTGWAFETARAAHAIDCLTKGLIAVHEVGVVHRDIKPDNVLCCGYGESEIFKVADFGVARPLGLTGTFGGSGLGTPGYAAPEVIVSDAQNMGVWSDVFSLAAVIYFLLTGQEYFPSRNVAEAILHAQDPHRRSLLECPALCPELRNRKAACHAIDLALARASAAAPDARPPDVQTVAATVIPWLKTDSLRLRPPARRLDSSASGALHRRMPGWSWTMRSQPGSDVIVRSVAWDGDGRCLAATNRGLAFFNGEQWQDAPLAGLGDPTGIRYVRRIGAGRWLVGCDPATFAIYTTDGVGESVRLDDASLRIELFSGDVEDLAIVVASHASSGYAIHTLLGRRWLKPFALQDVAAVTSVARIADARWLIAGRSTRGAGIVGTYEPLRWEFTPIPTPPIRAFLAAGGHPDHGMGLVAGADGVVVLHDASSTTVETIEGGLDISAVVVDALGNCWAAGAGRIWRRDDGTDRKPVWTCAWEDAQWQAPVVSLYADLGLVIGMTADGAIVEGRGIGVSKETGTFLGVSREA